ncbi:hypothetical protein [Arsenicibacter rosenii]|uniref:Uncharacterized protein n=1 Tax=Arsenicibacter rosenii TaxID=1750698 RepID=A0A1S2VC02_9BACT|nr:hypothetical protein [Arsenicibacter rosenii]OIN55756.1 hypothetical protein BLX24_28485 [Arsenicibacter rosenii]
MEATRKQAKRAPNKAKWIYLTAQIPSNVNVTAELAARLNANNKRSVYGKTYTPTIVHNVLNDITIDDQVIAELVTWVAELAGCRAEIDNMLTELWITIARYRTLQQSNN